MEDPPTRLSSGYLQGLKSPSLCIRCGSTPLICRNRVEANVGAGGSESNMPTEALDLCLRCGQTPLICRNRAEANLGAGDSESNMTTEALDCAYVAGRLPLFVVTEWRRI